ncbi:hypothetical protein DSO57_1030329 [Entomophthora muscae]|uniref:Uncharacterized protein n=1 Tax=Entomophthora muscae TaxID=34485 RepID=A0ACC2RFQ7_9FUNG|nr:hypothetical protein DSO57_1030329 [Entomophthora muscae]
MNNNLFPNVSQNVPQESSSAVPDIGSRFRFGTATNVVFGQVAPNEAPRTPAALPRFIVNRRRPGHQVPAAPKFVFNPNMPDEQVARLMAPLATNQPTPMVAPPSYSHLSFFAQPAAPDQVVNLFSNL